MHLLLDPDNERSDYVNPFMYLHTKSVFMRTRFSFLNKHFGVMPSVILNGECPCRQSRISREKKPKLEGHKWVLKEVPVLCRIGTPALFYSTML